MAIMVTCSSCGKTLQAKDEWAGKNVKCPSCQTVLTVPGLSAKPPSLPPTKQRDEDYDDEPAPPPRKRRDDDDDDRDRDRDRPVSRRRRDDDDDRPVRRRPKGNVADIQLSKFNVGVLVLLHFVTCGIFTFIWMMLMHGKLPQNRADDPSAGKAIGFMFIPCFNLYWIFFAYMRLMTRLNEAREEVGQPPDMPNGLLLAGLICNFIPYIGAPIGLILCLIAYCMIQSKVNEIVDAIEGA